MDFLPNFNFNVMIHPGHLPHHNHTYLLSILSFLGHLITLLFIYQSVLIVHSVPLHLFLLFLELFYQYFNLLAYQYQFNFNLIRTNFDARINLYFLDTFHNARLNICIKESGEHYCTLNKSSYQYYIFDANYCTKNNYHRINLLVPFANMDYNFNID